MRQKYINRSLFNLSILILILLCSALFYLNSGQVESNSEQNSITVISKLIFQSELTESDSNLLETIRLLRLPRLILVILVGANLAVAGALLQALFGNPLAEPYVIGISSGAAFGAVLAISVGFSSQFLGLNGIAIFAFLGACLTSFIVYTIAEKSSSNTIASLLLTGIAMSGLLQSITSLMILNGEPWSIRNVLIWIMGSFAYRGWNYVWVILPCSMIGLLISFLYHRSLNVLSTGEEAAFHLGFNVKRLKIILFILASLLAASSVTVCGMIPFVGLIVPHIMRLLTGSNYKSLIPTSILGGAILLIWSDLAAKNLATGQELPIGIITGIIGCLFFLYLLQSKRHRIF